MDNNKQIILERVLLLMKYDNKKTLSENYDRVISEQPKPSFLPQNSGGPPPPLSSNIETIAKWIDDNSVFKPKEWQSYLDSYIDVISHMSLDKLLALQKTMSKRTGAITEGLPGFRGGIKQPQLYSGDKPLPTSFGATVTSLLLENEIYNQRVISGDQNPPKPQHQLVNSSLKWATKLVPSVEYNRKTEKQQQQSLEGDVSKEIDTYSKTKKITPSLSNLFRKWFIENFSAKSANPCGDGEPLDETGSPNTKAFKCSMNYKPWNQKIKDFTDDVIYKSGMGKERAKSYIIGKYNEIEASQGLLPENYSFKKIIKNAINNFILEQSDYLGSGGSFERELQFPLATNDEIKTGRFGKDEIIDFAPGTIKSSDVPVDGLTAWDFFIKNKGKKHFFGSKYNENVYFEEENSKKENEEKQKIKDISKRYSKVIEDNDIEDTDILTSEDWKYISNTQGDVVEIIKKRVEYRLKEINTQYGSNLSQNEFLRRVYDEQFINCSIGAWKGTKCRTSSGEIENCGKGAMKYFNDVAKQERKNCKGESVGQWYNKNGQLYLARECGGYKIPCTSEFWEEYGTPIQLTAAGVAVIIGLFGSEFGLSGAAIWGAEQFINFSVGAMSLYYAMKEKDPIAAAFSILWIALPVYLESPAFVEKLLSKKFTAIEIQQFTNSINQFKRTNPKATVSQIQAWILTLPSRQQQIFASIGKMYGSREFIIATNKALKGLKKVVNVSSPISKTMAIIQLSTYPAVIGGQFGISYLSSQLQNFRKKVSNEKFLPIAQVWDIMSSQLSGSEKDKLNEIMKENPSLVEDMSKSPQMMDIVNKIKDAKGFGEKDIKRYEEKIDEINKKTKELANSIIEKYSKNKKPESISCEMEISKDNILDYDGLEYDIKKHPSKPNIYCVNKKIQK
jgi:hypothetical protein